MTTTVTRLHDLTSNIFLKVITYMVLRELQTHWCDVRRLVHRAESRQEYIDRSKYAGRSHVLIVVFDACIHSRAGPHMSSLVNLYDCLDHGP